jgi:hypothetical protein
MPEEISWARGWTLKKRTAQLLCRPVSLLARQDPVTLQRHKRPIRDFLGYRCLSDQCKNLLSIGVLFLAYMEENLVVIWS